MNGSGPNPKYVFVQFPGTIPRVCASCIRSIKGKRIVLGRNSFTWRAATLLKMAKSISDPNVAGALVERAADLKSQLDQANPPDKSPRAPDVEFPTQPYS
jgi:hypothetical protein